MEWTYLCIPKLQRTTVEVWEWISNLILHFTGHVITYPSFEKGMIFFPYSFAWCINDHHLSISWWQCIEIHIIFSVLICLMYKMIIIYLYLDDNAFRYILFFRYSFAWCIKWSSSIYILMRMYWDTYYCHEICHVSWPNIAKNCVIIHLHGCSEVIK